MKFTFKWLLLANLILVCLGVLSIGHDLVETKQNRSLVYRTQNRLSDKLSFLSMNLVLLGTVQLVSIGFLLAQFRKTTDGVQAEEITGALEGLNVSRFILKRDSFSQQEVMSLMRNLALELLESKKILAYLIERGSDVALTITRQGNLTSVSRSSLSSWGYSPQELEGCPANQLIDDRQIKALMTQAQTGQRAVVETTMKTRDGEGLHVIWTAYWSAGEETLFCVVEDVTTRKKAEEQLRLILNALPAGVLVTNEEPAVIEFANTQACNLLAASREQLHACPLSRVWEYDPAQVTADGSFFKTVSNRSDGSKFPVEFSMRRIEYDGQIKKLFVFLDITSQEAVEKMKNEFLAMITHDLRTPLATLRGMVVLLDKGLLGTLNEKGRSLTTNVSRDLERLNRLIDDMLDLEKVGAGKMQLECVQLRVAEVLEQAQTVLSLHAAAKNISLVIECQADLHCWGDRDQLVRVVVNLLSNALKYSPENASIVIRAEDLQSHVRVSIIDQGRGIPPDKIDRIFEKFEQTELADAKKYGGTGLGLAICKVIVEEHGGNIGALNNQGVGATFWFTVSKSPFSENPAQ